MKQIAVAVVLIFAVGCTDRGAPVSPSGVQSSSTALGNGGAPATLVESYESPTCSFPLLVEMNGKSKELVLGDRLKILFPAFVATLKNLDSGKQLTLSVTGSFHIKQLPNGDTEVVYTGRNTIDDFVPGGSFIQLIGRFTEVYDADFNLVQPVHGDGQIVDLCQALA
jgi:hypothetical protein